MLHALMPEANHPRAVFDLSVGPSSGDSVLLPGTHTASGGFSTKAAAPVQFVVQP